MTPDNEPGNNPELAKRAEVDRVKGLIKKDNLIFRGHDVDNPGENDLDGKEEELIGSFGLEKIETVQQMFDAMNDPNRIHDVVREKMDILATAVCESILEDSARKEIVIAGSSSVEKQLLWVPGFSGRDKKNEDTPSFSFMVAEKFREKIGAGEKRDEVTSVMEYLDFIKNSDYAKNGGLAEAAAQAEERLARIKPNVLNRDEMQAYAELKQYVSTLHPKNAQNDEMTAAAKEMAKAAKEISTASQKQKGRDQFRPRVNENGEVEGGVESAWQVTPEKLADSMLFMDSSVRWQSYTPPEWFKALPEKDQARIEYMIMICDGAANLSYAGKDYDKILGNRMYYAFDNEKMTGLFNGDFKLVVSKMLNDLCEPYVDPDDPSQMSALRYKEVFDQEKGAVVIHPDVRKNLENIRAYENKLAKFLAEYHGRSEPNVMDRMNAYTAWNMFYMYGDSSHADRLRLLPTYGHIISDAVRTLNPESKARIKLKISKGETESDNSQMFEAENTVGNLGYHVESIMKIERDLGKPLFDEKKTLKKKIVDGDFPLLRFRMCYGFFDFVAGGRDLYKKTGVTAEGKPIWGEIDKSEGKVLSKLLMDHATFDKAGNLISVNEEDDAWSFGGAQVDFLNWFRDHQETAVLALNGLSGKLDLKNVGEFAKNIKDKIGQARGTNVSGKILSYTTNPVFWANLIWGAFPIDKDRFSTDYIRTKVIDDSGKNDTLSYSMYVNELIRDKLALSDTEMNQSQGGIVRLMNLLGVDIKKGESGSATGVILRNDTRMIRDKMRTEKLRKYLVGLRKTL